VAKIVLYDLARIVKVTVTVFKKLFVICAGFSRHCFQNFFCAKIVEEFDIFEGSYTKEQVLHL